MVTELHIFVWTMLPVHFQSLEEFLWPREKGAPFYGCCSNEQNRASEFWAFPFLSIADRSLEQTTWYLLIYLSSSLNTPITLRFLGPNKSVEVAIPEMEMGHPNVVILPRCVWHR